MKANETEFKKAFKKSWAGWLGSYEHGKGGDEGAPDNQVLIDGNLLPIEFKFGELIDGLVYPHDVRPAQISWNTRLVDSGGMSIYLIGVVEFAKSGYRSWRAFGVAPWNIWLWRQGLVPGKDCYELATKPPDIRKFVIDCKEERERVIFKNRNAKR